MKEITPQRAVYIGHLVVNTPAIIIITGIIGLWGYSAFHQTIPFIFGPLSILVGPAIAWLYWSFAITRWRIWAYSKVSNIQELKTLAEDSGLIWREGSFFEKTEIRSSKQRLLIEATEKKHSTQRASIIISDDPLVPPRSEFPFISESKVSISLQVALLILGGLYLTFQLTEPVYGYLSIGLGLFILINAFFTQKKEPLVLSDEGILVEKKFYNWNEIYEESIEKSEFYPKNKHYLQFISNDFLKRIALDDYVVSPSEVGHLLRVYRARHQQNSTNEKI